jgi:hypothetical protein
VSYEVTETLTQAPITRRSRIGGWIWFALMVGGWIMFLGVLFFSEATLGELRESVRDLPFVPEILLWLALFPYVLALTVWDSSWEDWLRLALVTCFAVGWSFAFYPRQRSER